MKNFVQPGDALTLTAPAAVASGAGVLVGSIFGVANGAAESGADVVLSVTGVFDLPKAAGAISAGAVVYWDSTPGVVTTVATDNARIGVAVKAAASGEALARVRLSAAF